MPLIATSQGAENDRGGFDRREAAQRPPFRPSPQQAEVFRLLEEEDCHVRVDARAGTGKSTTCREAAKRLDDAGARTVYAAFNQHIAKEFQADLPSGCRAATLHSMGLSLLRSYLGDVQVEKDKADHVAERFFPGGHQRAERDAAVKLASMCKSLLLDGEDSDELAQLAANFDIELPERSEDDVIASVPDILAACEEDDTLVDFDDMIWLPVMKGLVAKHVPDVMFVDEAQDLNAAQHDLVDLLAGGPKSRCRVVVVGDPFQAIYAWRGADAQSLETLSGRYALREGGIVRQPLTVTRRCPRLHVELARRVVADFEPLEGSPTGVIEEIRPTEAERWVRPGDMGICRTNAPLISIAYRIIQSGRKAVVRGRDIGTGLLSLIRRMRARDVGSLMSKVGDFRISEASKLGHLRNPGPALQALNDRCDCVLALCEGAASVEEVKQKALSIFSDTTEHNAVVFSSIHKAKGLERDRILVLCPELIPGPWSRTAEQVQQERNLAYVAATRSRHTLAFAGQIPGIFTERRSPTDY